MKFEHKKLGSLKLKHQHLNGGLKVWIESLKLKFEIYR